ncbi:MAG TPA: AbrB family transcriptional regulator [Chloroflexi bacterium]|jgi:membrane AbrB-like protein|nr:AbrB family transcriptional regulator [Chloroflexota bacterium]
MALSQATYRMGLTLAIGAAGGLLANAVHLPGGPMAGALVAVGGMQVLGTRLEEPPSWLRTSGRIVLGITIGATVTAETLRVVATSLAPVAVMVVFMLVLGLVTAWALTRLARMAPATAFCGASPGALSAMVTLADELGGSAPVVASMHLVRLVSVMLVVPPFVQGAFAPAPEAVGPLLTSAAGGGPLFWRQAALLVLGVAAGLLVTRLRVPAGDLVTGMVVAAVANPAVLHLPDLPITWKLFAQITIGAGVGATITREALADFKPFALAGGIMTVFLMASGLALAWVLSQVTSLDLITCIVGCAPGGADTMIILAGEFGANVPLVTAMHVSRIIILMVLLPPLIHLAVRRTKTPPAAARPTPVPGPMGEGG